MFDNLIHEIANYLGFGGVAGGGYAVWQARENKRDMDKMAIKHEALDDKVDQLALLLAQNYTPNREINSRFDKLDASLVRIEDKLDKKADK